MNISKGNSKLVSYEAFNPNYSGDAIMTPDAVNEGQETTENVEITYSEQPNNDEAPLAEQTDVPRDNDDFANNSQHSTIIEPEAEKTIYDELAALGPVPEQKINDVLNYNSIFVNVNVPKNVHHDMRFDDNPFNHDTPKIIDPTTVRIHEPVDLDGYPIKKTDNCQLLPRVSKEQEKALFKENPQLLEQCQRVRANEIKFLTKNATAKPTLANWMKYILGFGPAPSSVKSSKSSDKWPVRDEMIKRRSINRTIIKEPVKQVVTQELKQERQQIFELISKDKDTISASDAILLIQLWGYAPDKAACEEIMNLGEVNYQQISEICNNSKHVSEEDINTLMNIFSCFDVRQTGLISKYAFKSLLEAYGDAINPNLVEHIMQVADCANNRMVDYKKLIEEIISSNLETDTINSYRKIGVQARDIKSIKKKIAANV